MKAASGSSIRDTGLLPPRLRLLRLRRPRRPPGRHRQMSPLPLVRLRPVAQREFRASLGTGTSGFRVTGFGTDANTSGRPADGKPRGRVGSGCRRAGSRLAITCSGGPATGRDASVLGSLSFPSPRSGPSEKRPERLKLRGAKVLLKDGHPISSLFCESPFPEPVPRSACTCRC